MAGAPMTVPKACRLIRAISLIKLGNREGIKILDTLQLLKETFLPTWKKIKPCLNMPKQKVTGKRHWSIIKIIFNIATP